MNIAEALARYHQEHAFARELILPEEDRARFTSAPWSGGFRWFRSPDVNRLHRNGCLRAGWMGTWQWICSGEKVASINLRAELDRLHSTYRVCISGWDWEDVAETVRIVRVACRFGGSRPYFVCPGMVNKIACGRRVAKLYASGR